MLRNAWCVPANCRAPAMLSQKLCDGGHRALVEAHSMMMCMRLKFCPTCGNFDARRLKAYELGESAKIEVVYRCSSGHLFVAGGHSHKRVYRPYSWPRSIVPVRTIRFR
jgi:hypothetical protein